MDGLSDIAGVVTARLRPGRTSGSLVVNCSYDVEPTLLSIDWGMLTIDVADPELDYFLTAADHLIDGLVTFARLNRLGRICFVGASKGGFSALMLSRLLAERQPDLRVGAVAFAPMARLWPVNRRLTFPSYARLLERASSDSSLAEALEREGDQGRPASLPNLRWIVTYGAKQKRDTGEAHALSGTSLTLVPLPWSTHGVLTPWLCAGQPAHRIERIVAAAARTAETDLDMRIDGLTEAESRMAAEVAAMLPRPPIAALVAFALAPRLEIATRQR
jgi:hypothetical protein